MQLIIRPSGVWNSRAPLVSFFDTHRAIIRSVNLLTLTLQKGGAELSSAGSRELSASDFLVKQGGALSGKAWNSLKRTYGASQGRAPEGNEVVADLRKALRSITEYALIRYVAAVETQIHCWALNYLLAKLENGDPWHPRESKLAEKLSSLHNRNLPSATYVFKAIPAVEERLRRCTVFQPNTPETTGSVEATDSFNAWAAVCFWRDLRNIPVHRSNMLSGKFLLEHENFIRAVSFCYPSFPRLEAGLFMLTDEVFRAMSKSLVHFTFEMNQMLVEISSGRRGLVLDQAQGHRPAMSIDLPPQQPMLMCGDHAPSLMWTEDPEFRSAVRARYALKANRAGN